MFKTLCLLIALCLLYPSISRADGSFVYVTNYGDGTISQFRAGPNGTLTPLSPPTIKAYPRCHSMATDPQGRFLYVLSGLAFSRHNCLVSEFKIGFDGELLPLSSPAMSTPQNMAAPDRIIVEPRGHYLYILDHSGLFAQYRIKKDGTLLPLSPLISDIRAHGNLHFSLAYDQLHSV
jgi:6-phosphogluconolactonase (cycloisomerase 2 family)